MGIFCLYCGFRMFLNRREKAFPSGTAAPSVGRHVRVLTFGCSFLAGTEVTLFFNFLPEPVGLGTREIPGPGNPILP